MKYKIIYLIALMMIVLWVTDTHAVTIGQVAIHGFGGWAYGKTDNENRYLVGNEDGNYDHVSFSLNISANPYESLSIYVQPSYTEDSDGHEVGLDYAFAEWFVSEMLIFRAGKVKAPFMIYTEIYDVGTLRPFFTLPQGVYQAFAAEAYKGAGITGTLFTVRDWEILYDLYGGKLTLQPHRSADFQQREFVSSYYRAQDMLGGRLLVHTPVDGLNFSVSSYSGDLGSVINNEVQDEVGYTFLGISGEYLSDRLSIRSEYLTEIEQNRTKLSTVHFETAYRFTEHWQIAARYELLDLDIDLPNSPFPSSLFDHEELAVGLNYWFNPNLVLKCSYHYVEGNFSANPNTFEDYAERIMSDSLKEKTQLILVGVQFSF